MSEPRRDADHAFSFAVFVAALLPRLYVAIAWAREPVWDGHYYDFGAKRIAAGLGYSEDVVVDGAIRWSPWCHYPVGYSGFLAVVYKLFGAKPEVATVANAVTGALLVVVVHRLARRGLSPLRARVAAAICALHPGLILYAAVLMTEPLAALGIFGSVWLFVRSRDGDGARRRSGEIVAGLAMGLATLVRPTSLLAAPALAFFERTSLKRTVASVAIVCASSALVVLPWTVRNCRVMDGCALVSTNAGWNLAIGSFPRATGRFETLRATDGCPIVTGQVQQDRCWLAAGLDFIRHAPAHYASLVPAKLGFTFDHESFPIGYLAEADPAAWPEPRRAFYRDLLSGAHRLLLGAAALGAVAWPFRRGLVDWVAIALIGIAVALFVRGAFDDFHAFWPIAVFISVVAFVPLASRPDRAGLLGFAAATVATICVVHAVFFGEDRYHIVATPALALLAAGALRREDARAQRNGSMPSTSS